MLNADNDAAKKTPKLEAHYQAMVEKYEQQAAI